MGMAVPQFSKVTCTWRGFRLPPLRTDRAELRGLVQQIAGDCEALFAAEPLDDEEVDPDDAQAALVPSGEGRVRPWQRLLGSDVNRAPSSRGGTTDSSAPTRMDKSFTDTSSSKCGRGRFFHARTHRSQNASAPGYRTVWLQRSGPPDGSGWTLRTRSVSSWSGTALFFRDRAPTERERTLNRRRG